MSRRASQGGWGLLALLAAALVIRLVRIGDRGLWLDEAFSVWLASQPVDGLLAYRDYHPPLYALSLKGWMSLGTWAATDAGVRLPSALAGTVAVGAAVGLTRALRLPGAWLVGALCATSGLLVAYAQEARMYAPATACATLAAAALALTREGSSSSARRAVAWVGYALAVLVGIYLHYDLLAIWLTLALGYVLLIRPTGSQLAWWAAANAAVAVLYVPEVPRLVSLLDVPELLRHPLLARPGLLAGGLVSILVLLLGAAWLVRRRPRLREPALVSVALVVIVALDLAQVTEAGATVKRHLSILTPLLLVAASAAIAHKPGSLPWQMGAVLLGLPALGLVLFVQPKEDWRGAAQAVSPWTSPGSTVLVYPSFNALPFERYYTGPGTVVRMRSPDELPCALALSQDPSVVLVESPAVNLPPLAPRMAPLRATETDHRVLYHVDARRYLLAARSPLPGACAPSAPPSGVPAPP